MCGTVGSEQGGARTDIVDFYCREKGKGVAPSYSNGSGKKSDQLSTVDKKETL